MGIMITYHGYSNAYDNPVCNVYKNAGVHYTWQEVVCANSCMKYPLQTLHPASGHTLRPNPSNIENSGNRGTT